MKPFVYLPFSFEYLDVPDRDTVNCKDSYLLIGPQNCRRLCGVYMNGTAISFIAKMESGVRILYRRSNMFGLGFKLRYTIGMHDRLMHNIAMQKANDGDIV